jgi:hypothetical protein
MRSQTGKIKVNKEDIENRDIIGAALGFNPMIVSKVQESNKSFLTQKKNLDTTIDNLLGAYTKALRMGDHAAVQDAFEDIKKFNRENGNPLFMISMGKIANAVRSMISEAHNDVQSMGLNRKEEPYARRMLGQ